MTQELRALIIENEEGQALPILHELILGGFRVDSQQVHDADEMSRKLDEGAWDIILSIHPPPPFDDFEALRLAKKKAPLLPFIIISANAGEELAVSAIKAGADDYILKGNLPALPASIKREVRGNRRRQAAARARKDTDEKLLQSRKLEAIGKFVGEIAHDFNNQLTAIIGLSHIAAEELEEGHPAREDFNAICMAAKKSALLVSQLLAFGRKQPIKPRIMDLNAIISENHKLLGSLIGNDIRLSFSAGKDTPRVKIDPIQIEQVLFNLAANARDAMPEGGLLAFATRRATLPGGNTAEAREAPPGRYALLSVKDSGIGMDAGTRRHIFEPFFTTKPPGKGAGLGLATVFGLIRQSGGYIEADTAPDQGTTFRIYLPEVIGRVDDEQRHALMAPPTKGSETILLVEDDDSVRRILRRILSTGGYRVLEASDGQAGNAVLNSHRGPIHLLITDIVMPGMSGQDLAKLARIGNPEIKVIFASGYSEKAIIGHKMMVPGAGFIQKPIPPATLLRTVRETLDARSKQ